MAKAKVISKWAVVRLPRDTFELVVQHKKKTRIPISAFYDLAARHYLDQLKKENGHAGK